MDETEALRSLRAALEEIKSKADHALKKLEIPQADRAARWRCTDCGQTKHFTRPVPVCTAVPCRKCGGTSFQPFAG